jgi:hypothetical protein
MKIEELLIQLQPYLNGAKSWPSENPPINLSAITSQLNALQARIMTVENNISPTGLNVKNYGAVGDGVTDDTIAIINAISAAENGMMFPVGMMMPMILTLQGNNGVVFPAGTYLITDNITVPVGVGVSMSSGAVFSIAIGKTVTINGPFNADLRKCFDTTGTIVFGPGSVKEIYLEWWGAVGDGIAHTTTGTDNTVALLAAINATKLIGATVHLLSGIYNHTGLSFALTDFQSLSMVGAGYASILQNIGTGINLSLDGSGHFADQSIMTLKDFWLLGGAGTTHGLYLKGINHSHISDIHVPGCGDAGFYLDTCVCDVLINCAASLNEPLANGYTKRGIVLDNTQASTIINGIWEGITAGDGVGIDVGASSNSNIFICGTSEANTIGRRIGAANSYNNVFISIDFEANGVITSGAMAGNVDLGGYQNAGPHYTGNHIDTIEMEAGNGANPSLYFRGYPHTGLYRSADNMINFAVDSQPAMYLGPNFVEIWKQILPDANVDIGDWEYGNFKDLWLSAGVNLQKGSALGAVTDRARIYAIDNGSGKIKLMVKFPSGAAQQIAIEP